MRLRGLPAAAMALVVGVSGCALVDRPAKEEPAPPTSAAPRTPPPSAAGLEDFYQQNLSWARCSGGQCADLTVPLNYAEPGGRTIVVKVLRVPAQSRSQRLGSLVVNPGGPGASGIDYARAADFIVGKPVRQRFDVVGFDPRGVQRSAPVDCLPDEGMDAFLGQDPTPDDAVEQRQMLVNSRTLAQGCQARSGELFGHVSTIDTVKDMDILRAALAEARLNFLGKSYGTLLGATYAEQFPEQVGRFVLDGVLPPDLTPEEVAIGQAEGFERATRAWAQNCVDEGQCPLGNSVDAVMAGLRDLLNRLDSRPLPMRDGRLDRLTEGWAALGVAQAMYDQGAWATFTEAIRDVVRQGDGTELMRIADSYARRDPNGNYTDNLLEAFYAIGCSDNPDSTDPAVYAERAVKAAQKAPTFGTFLAWSSTPCAGWPVKSGGGGPHTISAEGSAPIVVVGTTRDPATPYEWSVRLHDQLANARLLTFDGDGHTAYARSNDCVDDAINDFYTDGTLFDDGLKC